MKEQNELISNGIWAIMLFMVVHVSNSKIIETLAGIGCVISFIAFMYCDYKIHKKKNQ